uniref:AlNc14C94G5782 protein n=1 Tax=Albugo laibachii Nc14 TaxID=890382 RepID=F0WGQ5_9STRA|nr:AlNc14C94G5782 [Albugo laibachii Nc14]|eukprot:CCA20419.1 AlNc14C94G5782 [Albugo laibachii Nc14]
MRRNEVGNRVTNAGGKVIDPPEENVAVDKTLCYGSDGRAVNFALVPDRPRHAHSRYDDKWWHREAARCHGGIEREMEAVLGAARVHVRRAAHDDNFARF